MLQYTKLKKLGTKQGLKASGFHLNNTAFLIKLLKKIWVKETDHSA